MSSTRPQPVDDAVEFARIVRAVKRWPEDSPERAAASKARAAAAAAGGAPLDTVRAGYDAGVACMLEPLTESSRSMVEHAIGLFGRGMIEVTRK